ncbi:MAG: polyphosphate kinase 1 [Lachnospiraceae bacterium]|nr:polyphosphate kinase 1 [Lachnospiraceae bacterium]
METNCYENRELSWLRFNERVLEEAVTPENPLCEQMSFLSIFQSNLDEFFMVRVGTLYDRMLLPEEIRDSKMNMTCEEQLAAIFRETRKLSERKDAVYRDLRNKMAREGVSIFDFKDLTLEEGEYLRNYFDSEVKPLLSPQIIGKKQPFPFLKNKEIYAVVVLEKKGSEKMGIVPCTDGILPQLVALPGEPRRFMLMKELILHFIPDIFERYEIRSKSLIRIIRSADIFPEEEELDYRRVMERMVRTRRRLQPVKLEYSRLMDPAVLTELCHYLGLSRDQIFYSEAPLDLTFLSEIRDVLHDRRELFYPRRSPQLAPEYAGTDSMIRLVQEKDRLLAFPFDSIDPFLNLLREAADDPRVASIKISLYRVASNSEIAKSLIRASENGKEVLVVVELRARFDEQNNIEWSRRLEEAGCRILYGLDYMKVHSKLCLITMKEEGEIRTITQIGTGNYNEKTSKLYTDLSLMTANPEIGREANEVFSSLCMDQVVESTEHLMVAPKCLQSRILEKIDGQIEVSRNGGHGYVGVKINSLADKVILDKFIEASRAGVQVELIVRGICCLIPGIPDLTENITIRSIVGRYLEHSRIYIFGEEVYISSADFMSHNTRRRVEVAAPVLDEDVRRRIRRMFDVMMRDNVKARIRRSDGSYVRAVAEEPYVNSQEVFFEEAYLESGRLPGK